PPKYRHFKPRGLAVVRIEGRDIYLGKFNSPESWEKYGRVIAEWRSGQATATISPVEGDLPECPTVNEVILEFMKWADGHYRHADGTPTGELDNFRHALRPLKCLYGSTPAKSFSPKPLKAIRQDMIDAGLSRGTINARVAKIV